MGNLLNDSKQLEREKISSDKAVQSEERFLLAMGM
jgi:hypothetical protein